MSIPWKGLSGSLVLMVAVGCALAKDPNAAMVSQKSRAAGSLPNFQENILPLMKGFCLDCHKAGTAMGGYALDHYHQSPDPAVNLSLWTDAYDSIVVGAMPVGRPGPSSAELSQMKAWIEAGIPEGPLTATPTPPPSPTPTPTPPSPTPSPNPTPLPPTPTPLPPSSSPTPLPPTPTAPAPPPNEPPIAATLVYPTGPNQPVAITLTATDPNNDPLTFTYLPPLRGSLSGSAPQLIYTPRPDFVGYDSFVFTATDPGGLIARGRVCVKVGWPWGPDLCR